MCCEIFNNHDFRGIRGRLVWFECVGVCSGGQRVWRWYLALSCRRTEGGGAAPPPARFPAGSVDSVSPRRDGDVRRAAACSVSQTRETQQQLNGNARRGAGVVVPQWAAELLTTGTWRHHGSWLSPPSLPCRLSGGHRWSWTLRYSCQ